MKHESPLRFGNGNNQVETKVHIIPFSPLARNGALKMYDHYTAHEIKGLKRGQKLTKSGQTNQG